VDKQELSITTLFALLGALLPKVTERWQAFKASPPTRNPHIRLMARVRRWFRMQRARWQAAAIMRESRRRYSFARGLVAQLATQELNDLRSVPDLASYQKEVQSRMSALNIEFAGLPFPDEAREEFATLKDQNEEIDRRVKELEARERMVQSLGLKDTNREREESERLFDTRDAKGSSKERDIYDLSTMRHNPWHDPEGARNELRDRALKAIEIARFPQGQRSKKGRPSYQLPDRSKIQEHIEYLLESTQQGEPGSHQAGLLARYLLITGSPAYRRGFWKKMTGGEPSSEEQRALSLTGSGGGFAIPFALDPSIIPTSNSVVNPVRAIARLETIAGANTWLGVSSGAIVASRAAELTEASDNAPLLSQPSATVTKVQTAVPFDIEIGEDWEKLESEFATLIQDAKDDEEATAFVTGAGTGVNPQGFVTGATATPVAAATGLTVTAANIRALEAALPPRFRANESFVANRGIYNVILGIDTAGGAALLMYLAQGLNTQSPGPGNTGMIMLGRSAWEASQMQATVVNATKIMICGDFRYFLVVDRIGLTVELIPHLVGGVSRLPTGQRALYAYWRNTSKTLSANAFAVLQGTA